MATTIKLKNSEVKDKVPAAGDIQIGELCVGAHSESPALFFKDNADNIIKIQPGSGVEPSPTPPESPEAGDLWFDSNNETLNFWDGAAWVELGEAGDSPVKSVNTKTGAVVLDAADVGALAAGDDVSELTNDAGYITLAEVPSALVSSVNTKTGDVVLDASDVGALASGDNVSELINDAGYLTGTAAGDTYLPLAGGDLTGDLTLGTDKVVLDASDGSAIFKSFISSDSYISAKGNVASNNVWQAYYIDGATNPITSTIKADGSASFAGEVLAGTRARFNTDGARANAQSVIDIYDQDGQGVNPSTVRINAEGSAGFKGDVSIGDSATFFNLISDVVAALPEEIKEEFALVIATWNQASAYTDVSTLPADIPAPLKDAVVRVATAGKINLNADGSATFGGGNITLFADGVFLNNNTIQSNRNDSGNNWEGFGPSGVTSKINSDGTITATGYSMASLAQL